MKYVYLAHSEMSLRCLEGLITKSLAPSLVVISVMKEINFQFRNSMIELCRESGIGIVNICGSCADSEIPVLETVEDLIPEISEYDFGLSVGFMKILPEKVFSAPRLGMINLHCGRLPQYRGRAPISRAIMEGESSVIVSVHKIDQGVDSGDVIEELVVQVSDTDDVNSIYEKCCESSSEAAEIAVRKLMSKNPAFRKQLPDIAPREKISESERRINWNASTRNIFNKIRAITFPYPGSVAVYEGNEIIVLASEIPVSVSENVNEPGRIIKTNQMSVQVAAKDGHIILKDLFRKGSLIKDCRTEFEEGKRFS